MSVVNLDSARPHRTASVQCEKCRHRWQAVYPENSNYLICPSCASTVNEYGTVVYTAVCATCKREFSLCPPPKNPDDWRHCLSEDCASYDPARDVDKFLDEDGRIFRDDEP